MKLGNFVIIVVLSPRFIAPHPLHPITNQIHRETFPKFRFRLFFISHSQRSFSIWVVMCLLLLVVVVLFVYGSSSSSIMYVIFRVSFPRHFISWKRKTTNANDEHKKKYNTHTNHSHTMSRSHFSWRIKRKVDNFCAPFEYINIMECITKSTLCLKSHSFSSCAKKRFCATGAVARLIYSCRTIDESTEKWSRRSASGRQESNDNKFKVKNAIDSLVHFIYFFFSLFCFFTAFVFTFFSLTICQTQSKKCIPEQKCHHVKSVWTAFFIWLLLLCDNWQNFKVATSTNNALPKENS